MYIGFTKYDVFFFFLRLYPKIVPEGAFRPLLQSQFVFGNKWRFSIFSKDLYRGKMTIFQKHSLKSGLFHVILITSFQVFNS